jgi:uncharacterized protein YqjF (DUF2071 family)
MNPPLRTCEHDHARTPIGLIADWRNFVFLHFAVPPEDLAPHVPYPLDLHEGWAYVSLVSFRLERMRPARWLPPAIGRWLMRPVSDHLFLNVRTYVRGPAGAGIHFIAEWIDNPLSVRLGPLTYGLPYRFAAMERTELPGTGLTRIAVRDPQSGLGTHLVVPTTGDAPARTMDAGTAGAFLLERYIAYTHHRGKGRWFEVRHAPWQAAPFQLARFDTALFEREYPWFRRAVHIGGHLAAGFADIQMGLPRRVTAPAASPALAIEPALAR